MQKEDRFGPRLSDERQKETCNDVRGMFREMEYLLDRVIPAGREN